jgi:hypothetical protein
VSFPENFDLLAVGEDSQTSKDAIEASEDLSLHARMIERAMSMMDHMAKRRPALRRGRPGATDAGGQAVQ